MDESRIHQSEDNGDVEFKTAFKGYNVTEVNEYISSQRADLKKIREENEALHKKINKLSQRLLKLDAAEEERKKALESINAEADRIIRGAKKKAAQELLRTRRKCARMVAEMTEQVDEQKRLYEATKIEAAKFRCELFSLYRNHIELINAMSEASGAFDEDAASGITDEDIANMEKLLEENFSEAEYEEEYEEVDQSAFDAELGQTLLIEAFSDTASITIPPSAKAKNEKKNQNAKSVAVSKSVAAEDVASEGEIKETSALNGSDAYTEAIADASDMLEGDDVSAKNGFGGENSEEEIAEEESFKAEEAVYEETESAEKEKLLSYANANDPGSEATAFIITEEDLDEFTNPDGAEMEYDSPVSIDSVFKKNSSDDDFDKLYGDDPKEESYGPEKTISHSDGNRKQKKNSYGFNVTSVKKRDPDDDSNEFYMESDAEFDPSATDGVPTGTVSSFGINSRAPSTERRWKVKKSKSLTDEFDVIKAEADED